MTQELIARIEAATGPDWEIDRAIMELLCLAPDYAADWGGRGFERPAPFAYTVSIDAALTLVPEGYFPVIDFVKNRCWIRDAQGFDMPNGCAYGFAATPALALCAAALKARLA